MSKATVSNPMVFRILRGAIALFVFPLLAGILPASARQAAVPAAKQTSSAKKPISKPLAETTTKKRTTVRHTRRVARRGGRRPAKRAITHRKAAARRLAVHHAVRPTYRRPTRYRRSVYQLRLDPGAGDDTQFDDPLVRKAALEALHGNYGSVVAVNPNNGRILSVVNQKLAFSAGFEPCSTIKPVIALAALKEGLINRYTKIHVGRYTSLDLTEAIAHSNNQFFATLGQRLGFQTVSHFAHLLGLGEPAGMDMPEEHAGTFPSEAPPARLGGIGKMTSFGEGIRITPLQLAAMMSAFANGGSLYYLQYPQSDEQEKDFVPRLKRTIDMQPYAADIREGMLGAVEFGTARESYTPDGELVYAKTGTCTDETEGGHLGWFVSYVSSDGEQNHPKLVLVVLLRRYGPRVSGPHAAEIGGRIYRQLYMQNFFSAEGTVSSADEAGRNR